MAVYTNAGGGGGLSPDDLTAEPGDVLKGKIAGVKSSDEPAAGTLEFTGNASDSQVLAGLTYYNTNPKTKRTGTMVNQGAKTAALNAGGSYTIPAGYHNGAGKVTANTLASQTGGATAEDKYVYKGKIYWKDGTKRTGTMTVGSVVSFSVAATAYNRVTATWKWPANGPYSGVIIRYKTGSYPTSVTDGTQGYKGTGTNSSLNASSTVTISGLTQGTKYYFRIWVYATCSAGDLYSGTKDATVTTTARGTQTFKSSGTFTVPAGVTKIDIFCVGGGGAGRVGWVGSKNRGGRGGCGGYTTTKKAISVTAGGKYTVTVGAGGSVKFTDNKGNYQINSPGKSSFGTLVEAAGGDPQNDTSILDNAYWRGGSGGGWGANSVEETNAQAGASDGGSRGNNIGQGTTTRAFGESSGALYAGGGGGGAAYRNDASVQTGGAGGSGGGGKGADMNGWGNNAGANTGGGGGGGSGVTSGYTGGGAGGSGIVIVRWGY